MALEESGDPGSGFWQGLIWGVLLTALAILAAALARPPTTPQPPAEAAPAEPAEPDLLAPQAPGPLIEGVAPGSPAPPASGTQP